MKFLHTGDWHIGRSLSRQSRLDEAREALAEVTAIAEAEDVDAVLVCGDVFEHQSPAADAEQVVYEALLSLAQRDRSVVLLAGNHDHPGRWRALAPLFERFDVHVIDELRPPEGGGMIEIAARDGSTSMQIAAVPWVSERRLYGASALLEGSEKTYTHYADGMARAMQRLCNGFTAGKCHVLAGHIFVSGAIPSGTERPLVIGEIFAVNPNAIPATVQYAALGHVHKPQQVDKASAPTWYPGSLLRMDFGERGEEKCVNIVELKPNRPAKVRSVLLRTPRVLKEVHGRLEELERLANESQDAYYKIVLECDTPYAGLSDQVKELVPNALIVTLDYPKTSAAETVDVRSKTPRELFEGYLTSQSESLPDAQLVELFEQLLDEVSDEGPQRRLWEPGDLPAEAGTIEPETEAPPQPENATTEDTSGEPERHELEPAGQLSLGVPAS